MEEVFRLLIFAGVLSAVMAGAWLLRRYFRSGKLPRSFDLSDIGATRDSPVIVEFTSPYCYECKQVLPTLKAAGVVHGASVAVVDARDRPDLISKYGVRRTPTILIVDRSGRVRTGWVSAPDEAELEASLQSAAAPA